MDPKDVAVAFERGYGRLDLADGVDLPADVRALVQAAYDAGYQAGLADAAYDAQQAENSRY